MSKTSQEEGTLQVAIDAWREYACSQCRLEDLTGGSGYDLGCQHKHVELKGTLKETKGFLGLTPGEFDAARKDPLFELWLIYQPKGSQPVIYIVPRARVLELVRPSIHWTLPLGKARLSKFRKYAKERRREKQALGGEV